MDEAAMLANDDLLALTASVAAARAKLMLVGDPAQIGPVERAGGLLPALAARVGCTELVGIRRFSQQWEARATRLLRHGNPAIWTRNANSSASIRRATPTLRLTPCTPDGKPP